MGTSYEVSVTGNTQTPAGLNLRQPVLADPALRAGLV